MDSRDVTPLSITALAIIAILILVLHVAGGDLLAQSQAHASVAAPDAESVCPAEVSPAAASLPFD
jgi:predicted lysophospholipase L1 biosynthesis ABC-type transport system permease subunit